MRGTKALLLAVLFLIADMSALASASPVQSEESSEEISERLPFRGDRYATEDYGWWFAYGPDTNFDGLDDRLERIIAGEESQSSPAIILSRRSSNPSKFVSGP